MNGQILRQVRTKLAQGFCMDEAINAVLTSEDRCLCEDPEHGDRFPCFALATYRAENGMDLCSACYRAAHAWGPR